MGNGGGFYFTILQVPGAYRSRANYDGNDLDPGRVLGFGSFYNADAQKNAYFQCGFDPDFYSRHSFFVNIQNRVNLPALGLDPVRKSGANSTAVFGGKTYGVYEATLSDQLSTALGVGGWAFMNDIVRMNFKTSVNGSDILINPDTVAFTSGTGYAAPTDAIEAAVHGDLESIWPVSGNMSPIVSIDTGQRANSRILTKDVRNLHAVVVGSGNRQGDGGGGGRADGNSGYLYIPVESDRIVTPPSVTSIAFLFRANTVIGFHFRVVAEGENPSIFATLALSNSSAIRNVWEVIT